MTAVIVRSSSLSTQAGYSSHLLDAAQTQAGYFSHLLDAAEHLYSMPLDHANFVTTEDGMLYWTPGGALYEQHLLLGPHNYAGPSGGEGRHEHLLAPDSCNHAPAASGDVGTTGAPTTRRTSCVATDVRLVIGATTTTFVPETFESSTVLTGVVPGVVPTFSENGGGSHRIVYGVNPPDENAPHSVFSSEGFTRSTTPGLPQTTTSGGGPRRRSSITLGAPPNNLASSRSGVENFFHADVDAAHSSCPTGSINQVLSRK